MSSSYIMALSVLSCSLAVLFVSFRLGKVLKTLEFFESTVFKLKDKVDTLTMNSSSERNALVEALQSMKKEPVSQPVVAKPKRVISEVQKEKARIRARRWNQKKREERRNDPSKLINAITKQPLEISHMNL